MMVVSTSMLQDGERTQLYLKELKQVEGGVGDVY